MRISFLSGEPIRAIILSPFVVVLSPATPCRDYRASFPNSGNCFPVSGFSKDQIREFLPGSEILSFLTSGHDSCNQENDQNDHHDANRISARLTNGESKAYRIFAKSV